MTYLEFCRAYVLALTNGLRQVPINGRSNAYLNLAASLADKYPQFLEQFEANGSKEVA